MNRPTARASRERGPVHIAYQFVRVGGPDGRISGTSKGVVAG